MAIFNNTILTEKGQNLIVKSLSGEIINFTKIKTSDFIYPDNTNFEKVTSLNNIKQEIDVSNVSIENERNVRVKGVIANIDLESGYYLKNIGLYANDPDEGIILFSITTAIKPDYIPNKNEINVSKITVDLIIMVSNSSNVNLTVNSQGLVTVSMLDDYVLKKQLFNFIYPAGSIYTTVNKEFDPNVIFSGTWERYAEGQTLIGVDSKDSDFSTAEKVGGSKTTTLTIDQIPAHTHGINAAGNHAHGIHAVGDHAHTVGDHAHYMPAHQHVSPWGENMGVYKPDWDIWHGGGNGRMGNDRYTWDNVWGMTSWTDGWTHGSSPGTYGAGNHSHGMDAAGNHSHTANNTGGSKEHSNLQPYITVYFWKRIS